MIAFFMSCILLLSSSVQCSMKEGNMVCSAAVKKRSIKKVYQAYNNFKKNKKYESRMTKEELDLDNEHTGLYTIGNRVLDVDKNGVPELLVGTWYSGIATVGRNVYLYTYVGKKVKYVGKVYLTKKEQISGWTGLHYNSKTKKIWIIDGDETAWYVCYNYNGKSVKRERKEYLDVNDSAANYDIGKEIKFYNNTAKSRQKHLTFKLNKSKVTLKKSQKVKLKVTGKLSGLKWSSSNSKVAIVKNGTVTAKKAGKAVIKATLNGTTLKCKVTVTGMTKKQKIRKAYKKFLKGYFKNGKSFTYNHKKYKWKYKYSQGNSGGYYAIYDINNDGTEDLILYTMDICDTSNPSALFMYEKGKVKCIAFTGQDHFYKGFEKGNLIVGGVCDRRTGDYTKYYKVKKGKLKLVAKEFSDEGWGNEANIVRKYWIGKKKVSKSKFQKFLENETGIKNPSITWDAEFKFIQYK